MPEAVSKTQQKGMKNTISITTACYIYQSRCILTFIFDLLLIIRGFKKFNQYLKKSSVKIHLV